MIKGIVAAFAILLSVVFTTNGTVFAADVFGGVCRQNANGQYVDDSNPPQVIPADKVPAVCKSVEEAENSGNPLFGPDGILTRAIGVMSIVVAIISVIVIIISGIKMSLSQGDPGKISTSRSQLIYALVGLAVAVIAQSIVIFVLNKVKQ